MGYLHFTPSPDAAPLLYVHHASGVPTPLEPRDYSPCKEVPLPQTLPGHALSEQLETARRASQHWLSAQTSMPFGQVIGYEFAVTTELSIFLNAQGEFSARAPESTASSSRPVASSQEYVVGHQDDGFCSLLSFEAGESSDDQDLFYARRFRSLPEAKEVADENGASVFEVVRENATEVLQELTVDLKIAERLPFSKSYQVSEQFLAGPTFLGTSDPETAERLSAISRSGVGLIVSLIDPQELARICHAVTSFGNEGARLFQQAIFAVADQSAPAPSQMRMALDVIDAAHLEGEMTYLHCLGGRGRTGLVVGCWLARHGIATGEEALDRIAQLRFASGLTNCESPETAAQCRLVREWKEGE